MRETDTVVVHSMDRLARNLGYRWVWSNTLNDLRELVEIRRYGRQIISPSASPFAKGNSRSTPETGSMLRVRGNFRKWWPSVSKNDEGVCLSVNFKKRPIADVAQYEFCAFNAEFKLFPISLPDNGETLR